MSRYFVLHKWQKITKGKGKGRHLLLNRRSVRPSNILIGCECFLNCNCIIRTSTHFSSEIYFFKYLESLGKSIKSRETSFIIQGIMLSYQISVMIHLYDFLAFLTFFSLHIWVYERFFTVSNRVKFKVSIYCPCCLRSMMRDMSDFLMKAL